MFIELSTQDQGLWTKLQSEAHSEGEKPRHFAEYCFRENNDSSSDFISDERVTFDGHGSITRYAGKSPQEFVNLLTQDGGKYQLPPTVKVIDLVGCDIGLRPHPDRKSYVEVFTELLRAKPGYEHIQVNAFIHPNEKIPGTNNAKYSTLISMVGSEKVYVFTAQEYANYKRASDDRKVKFNEYKAATENKAAIDDQLKVKAAEYRVLEIAQKDDKALMKKVAEITNDIGKLSKTPSGRPTNNQKNLSKIKLLKAEQKNLLNPPKKAQLASEIERLESLSNQAKNQIVRLTQEYKQRDKAVQDQLDRALRYSAGGKMRENLNKDKYKVPDGYRAEYVVEEGLTLDEIFEDPRKAESSPHEVNFEEIQGRKSKNDLLEKLSKQESHHENQNSSYLNYKSHSNNRFAIIKEKEDVQNTPKSEVKSKDKLDEDKLEQDNSEISIKPKF